MVYFLWGKYPQRMQDRLMWLDLFNILRDWCLQLHWMYRSIEEKQNLKNIKPSPSLVFHNSHCIGCTSHILSNNFLFMLLVWCYWKWYLKDSISIHCLYTGIKLTLIHWSWTFQPCLTTLSVLVLINDQVF